MSIKKNILFLVLVGFITFGGAAYSEECKTSASCSQKAVEAATQAIALAKTLVPKGAVMPFNLESCPIGWDDYIPAYGRFVRGIDKTGIKIDPDGQRKAGTHQADGFKAHTHYSKGHHGLATSSKSGFIGHTSQDYNGPKPSESAGESETRPKNVALLYCEKN